MKKSCKAQDVHWKKRVASLGGTIDPPRVEAFTQPPFRGCCCPCGACKIARHTRRAGLVCKECRCPLRWTRV